MKYVVAWQMPHKPQSDEALAQAFEVFDQKPERKELKYLQMLGRQDYLGGFMVVETDVPTAIVKEAGMFMPFFEYAIYPVLDIQEFAQAAREAGQELARIKSTVGGAKPYTQP